MRHGNVHADLVHLALYPDVERPRDAPLLQRQRLDLPFHDHPVGIETVQSPHFDRPQHFASIPEIGHQFRANFANHLRDLVDIGGKRHPHFEHRISKIARQILHHLDMRERNGVNGALPVTQPHRTDGQRFHHARMAAVDLDRIANGNGVLDDDEKPRDQIGHQRLRAETHRQPNHAGASEQRRYVQPEIGSSNNRRDAQQSDKQHIADQRQHGARAHARTAPLAAWRIRIERLLNPRVDQDPRQPRDENSQQDRTHRVRDTARGNAFFREFRERKTPEPRREFEEDQPDQQYDQAAKKLEKPSHIGRLPARLTLRQTRHAQHDGAKKQSDHQQPSGCDRHLQHVLGGPNARERRDHRRRCKQQHRHLPERTHHFAALLVRAAADQMGHRPLERQREIAGQDRRAHVRDRREQRGQVRAKLLRYVIVRRGVAECAERSDQE